MKRKGQSIAIAAVLLLSIMAITTPGPAVASRLAKYAPADCSPGWSVVPSPNPGSYNQLYGVAAISPGDVWAVGEQYTGNTQDTLVEHWDGSSWSVVPSPNPGSFNLLLGVSAVSSSDVWAIGEYSIGNGHTMNLTEHWDGTSWSVVPSLDLGTGVNKLNSVVVIASNDVWVVGYYAVRDAAAPLTEHWDGTAWHAVPSPDPGNINDLTKVVALSSNDVWAVGSYSGVSGPSRTMTEHWDGISWSLVPSLNLGTGDNRLDGIAQVSSNNVWAVGYYAVGGYPTNLTEHWDGTSWSVIPSPDPVVGSNELNSIAQVSSDDVWAVGYSYSTEGIGSTLTEHWNGTSWSVAPSPNPGSNRNMLNAVAPLSSSDVWAVGGAGSGIDVQSLTEHYSTTSCGTNTPTPTPQPTVCPNPFVDIYTNVFFHAINSLYCQGVVSGTDASHYAPSGTASRSQFAKLVALAFGLPLTTPSSGQDFTDVPPSYWAYLYIESGYAASILNGFDAPSCAQFGQSYPCYLPGLPINRGQLTKLVVNAGGYTLSTPTTGPTFTDVPPSSPFYTYIETAHVQRVINGYPDGTFRPNNSIRRDEMGGIVYTAQQNQPTSPTPTDTAVLSVTDTPGLGMTDTPTTTATPLATDTHGTPTSTFTPTPLPSPTFTPTLGLAKS